MDKSLKRLFGRIHLWLGLLSGLVVFILGITGCIWVFEEELKAWLYADKLFVDTSDVGGPLPLSENLKAAQAALGPGMPIQRTYVQNRKGRSYYFRHYALNEGATGIWYWDKVKHNIWVYMDPYTSEVLEKENRSREFFNVVFRLHWSLLLTTEIGQPIVGTATLIFVVMLITGLVLWWPQNKKALKMRTWFRWKPSTKWRRKNYDLHNILGFYSMFLVVFIALTGLMWAFDWFSDGVTWVANGGSVEEQEMAVRSRLGPLSATDPLDKIHGALVLEYPQAESFYIGFPQDSLDTYSVYVSSGNLTRMENDQLWFDQYSGEELSRRTFADKSGGEKVWDFNFDIHVGAIGGIPGKIIAFFLSLFSASLPVTGFLIWYGRKSKKKKGGPT